MQINVKNLHFKLLSIFLAEGKFPQRGWLKLPKGQSSLVTVSALIYSPSNHRRARYAAKEKTLRLRETGLRKNLMIIIKRILGRTNNQTDFNISIQKALAYRKETVESRNAKTVSPGI